MIGWRSDVETCMRAGLVVLGLLAGCGDDEESGPVPFDRTLCESIPFYLAEEDGSCYDITDTMLFVTMEEGRACNVDTDCQVVSGLCNEFPSGACWYAVNLCDSPVPPWPDASPPRGWVDVSRFRDAYLGRGCSAQPACPGNCGPPPDVVCDAGLCTCTEPNRCYF